MDTKLCRQADKWAAESDTLSVDSDGRTAFIKKFVFENEALLCNILGSKNRDWLARRLDLEIRAGGLVFHLDCAETVLQLFQERYYETGGVAMQIMILGEWLEGELNALDLKWNFDKSGNQTAFLQAHAPGCEEWHVCENNSEFLWVTDENDDEFWELIIISNSNQTKTFQCA